MKYTLEQIQKMSATEIRAIKFKECKCCDSQDECDGTSVESCRYRIINGITI